MVLVDVDIAGELDDFQVEHIYNGGNTIYNGVPTASNATWNYHRNSDSMVSQFDGNNVFYLFRGITIPQGSVISDATLTIPDVERNGIVDVPFSIRAVNNSVPTNVGSGYTGGGGTAFATPVLTPVNTFTATTGTATDFPVDVQAHVQALVDAFDYSNDNMMFRMAKKFNSLTTQSFSAQGFEYQVSPPDSSANLTINYVGAEVVCNSDYCEDFNDYAFQKLPTTKDNFNYSTQALADGSWVIEGTRVRANATTEVIDIDCTKESVLHQTAFDLGVGAISDEKWVLRFDCEILTTSVPATNDFSILVNISDSDQTVGVLSAQDTITWEHNVQGGTGVDRMLLRWSDGVGILPGTGNNFFVTTGAPTAGGGKFYIEIKRLSSTTCIINHYSDAKFTTLVDTTGVQAIPPNIANLRYIRVSTRDDVTSAGAQTAQIDKIEFWNGGQQGDQTFQDDFTQKAVTLLDDFSSYADQGSADTAWVPQDIAVQRVNITTDVLDWDSTIDNTNNSIAHDLGSAINDEQWALRFKYTTASLVNGDTTGKFFWISLSDSDGTVDSETTQDFISFFFFTSTATTTYDVMGGDGVIPSSLPNRVSFTTTPTASDVYFVVLKRTSSTTVECQLFSDATYSTLVESVTTTIPSTVTGLRYISLKNRNILSATGGMTGTIDDVEFYNGNSTIIDWLGATGNDVGLDTVDGRVNFDIPEGVERDELLVHDLQSSIGQNADGSNWVLRFKIITDSITQGASEQSSSLFVGLDDGLLPAHTLGHDFISFGVVIDQGGAGPAFGATTTLRTGDNAQYFGGAIAGSNFPIAWTTGTLYVEVKRLSPILAECTLYSDALYRNKFSETQQVTIASTLDNLRYIRITTDSFAVANDNPWDGSIDDIEFYNCVSVPKTVNTEDKDFEDNFLEDNWTDTGVGMGVNTGTQVIDWDAKNNNTQAGTTFDLGSALSDDEWTVRFKMVIDTATVISTTSSQLWVVVGDTLAVNTATAEDYIGIRMVLNNVNDSIRIQDSDGQSPNTAGDEASMNVSLTGNVGVPLYVEMKRLTSTSYRITVYSDPDYQNVVSSTLGVCVATTDALRYIKVFRFASAGTTSDLDGTIDDIEVWDRQSGKVHKNVWTEVNE